VTAGSRAVARRYARALWDVALGEGDPASTREGLIEARGLIEGHPELLAALTRRGLSGERKAALVSAVAGRTGLPPLVRHLLDLLAARDRVGLLGAIEEGFVERWNAHRGVMAAAAVSARPLSPEQRAAVAEAVGRAVGGRIELSAAVDPSLVGGVMLRMGGRTFDGTVRGRLRALRERLAGAPGRG
jgi:F-type H+-transporting ATPase subunit delta